MKHVVLNCLIFLSFGVSFLRAGSIVTLTDTPEANETIGQLTLTPESISVQTGTSPTEINLSDVLEANFGDAPFQVPFFTSSGSDNQLPAAWKAQDVGAVDSPGSVVVKDGIFSLSAGGGDPGKESKVSDKLFFVGQPWTGDGQWTARVKSIDPKTPATAGLMMRNTLDASSMKFCLETAGGGVGGCAFRPELGAGSQEIWEGIWHGVPIPMNLPIWFRLTRYGAGLFAAISSDGNEWTHIAEYNPKILTSPWIGLFAEGYKNKVLGNVAFDQVAFTPAPSSAQILPPGVLLQSGSFLAGVVARITFDPASPDADGIFRRNGKPVAIPPSKIAAVTMLPTTRSQIAEMSSHVGLLMKNSDVMDGDFDVIDENNVRIGSVLLGITTYSRSDIRACLLQPVHAQPANYEIRLKDGSIVYANSLNFNKGDIAITEVSGVTVTVSPEEIAQFRAGSSQVQTLAELNWKATPPPAAPAAAPAPTAASATNAAPAITVAPVTNVIPAANGGPVANPDSDQPPLVQTWEGPNQEQIMETPTGTILEFPLNGKFHAIGVWIALSPDSPPNSNITIRVLADGKEIARTPAFRAGDQPRFMEATLQDPKTVALEADSFFAGTKALFIDPVAIRDK